MTSVSHINVSVIVPIYNISQYVQSSVREILEISLDNVEFIFVDDCSTDLGFNELISMVSLEYSQLNVNFIRNERNVGVSATRNIGLKYAKGNYVYFSDADDIPDKNIITKLYHNAQEFNSDIVWCDFYNVYGAERIYVNQYVNIGTINCIKALLEGQLSGALWNKLIRKKLFTENNISFPDGLDMSEDLRVCVELFYYAQKKTYINEALYHYIKSRPNSITNSNVKKVNFVNLSRIENVKGIGMFISKKGIQGVDKELNILKLMAKKSLLLTADSLSAFKKWRDIFPEANGTMKESNFPWFYKLLSNEINNKRWLFPYFWIHIKKIKNMFTQN